MYICVLLNFRLVFSGAAPPYGSEGKFNYPQHFSTTTVTTTRTRDISAAKHHLANPRLKRFLLAREMLRAKTRGERVPQKYESGVGFTVTPQNTATTTSVLCSHTFFPAFAVFATERKSKL